MRKSDSQMVSSLESTAGAKEYAIRTNSKFLSLVVLCETANCHVLDFAISSGPFRSFFEQCVL